MICDKIDKTVCSCGKAANILLFCLLLTLRADESTIIISRIRQELVYNTINGQALCRSRIGKLAVPFPISHLDTAFLGLAEIIELKGGVFICGIDDTDTVGVDDVLFRNRVCDSDILHRGADGLRCSRENCCRVCSFSGIGCRDGSTFNLRMRVDINRLIIPQENLEAVRLLVVCAVHPATLLVIDGDIEGAFSRDGIDTILRSREGIADILVLPDCDGCLSCENRRKSRSGSSGCNEGRPVPYSDYNSLRTNVGDIMVFHCRYSIHKPAGHGDLAGNKLIREPCRLEPSLCTVRRAAVFIHGKSFRIGVDRVDEADFVAVVYGTLKNIISKCELFCACNDAVCLLVDGVGCHNRYYRAGVDSNSEGYIV